MIIGVLKEEEEFELAETYYKNALKVGGSVTCYEKLLELYLDRTNEHHKAKDLLEEALLVRLINHHHLQ